MLIDLQQGKEDARKELGKLGNQSESFAMRILDYF